ncbi:MAG TPA: HAMP domain-containing sensor histidine kinase [Bacteroidota bacterium]|nr:HAMP domain-containing sensor histidine kinase [Bacteroidota bacterium]
MTAQRRPQIRIRFPLFSKLITGFIVVILFMVASMVTILLQLRPLVEGKTDFRGAELAQDIGRTFGAVEESARRYVASGETKDLQTFLLLGGKFTTDSETLKVLVDTAKHDIKVAIDSMISHAREYIDLVAAAEGGRKNVPGPESSARGRLLGEKVRLDVSRVREYYLGTMVKSLKSLNTQTTNSIAGAYIILGLSLVIGIALGILIAKTLTRPIQALKAGSQKVGEGHYETVPVTTNDEVAELTVAFNLMSDKLRQLDEMRMEMMSEISHEMRTPLQVIKAGCYSIIHAKDVTPLAQKQRDAVGMIHQATNRINQFVNSFLDIAKMEAGLMKFRFEESNLVEVLNPLVQEAQLIAQTRQISLEFLATGIPPLRLDRERVSQVFSNLLSNALKYTPDQGHIHIRVQVLKECPGIAPGSGGCVRVDVEDSGVGIPKDDLARLFSKFYQAQNVPLVNEKGSGLGLALVKHVTEAHGGSVSVASEVGVGSTFSVILPIA